MIKHIDRIYLLNLPRRVDRLEYQINQFQAHGITNYEVISPIVVADNNNFLNKPIRSCYLSHLSILDKIKSHQKLSLILEDDAHISNIQQINDCLDSFFSSGLEWDMFYFYHHYGNDYDIHKDSSDKPYFKITGLLNTHAYMVNPTSVSSIINILLEHKKAIENKEIAEIKNSHIDRAYLTMVHPVKNIFTSSDRLIVQNKILGNDIPWYTPDND